MALDYSSGCVNFRDVGEFVNLIAPGDLLPEGILFRGGKLTFVTSAEDMCSPDTIINLRKSEDAETYGAKSYWFPISNDLEVYDTGNQKVREWLNDVIRVFEDKDLPYPVLIHCNSGKDRTGVVVAALLKILGISEEIIVEEYLLSDGDVRREWILQSIKEIGDPEIYFKCVDIEKVRENILKIKNNLNLEDQG